MWNFQSLMEFQSIIAPCILVVLNIDGISKKRNDFSIIAFQIITLYEVTRGAHDLLTCIRINKFHQEF